ncbi:MAG: SAM-dependent methyltransferase [Burkholderiales bacterium]
MTRDPAADPLGEFIDSLGLALAARTFVKLTLSKPRRPGASGEPAPKQAFGRLVEIQQAPHLSLVLRYPTNDITENHPIADASAVIGRMLTARFANAHLFTTQADIELRTNNKGEPRVFRGKPTFEVKAPVTHDHARDYLLDPTHAPYLQALGIANADGKIKGDKADKYKQLQHIVKLLDDFMGKSTLRSKPRLRVVDMGCGKGYLTFALYDYFNNTLGIDTEVIGVDRNPTLVALCNRIDAQVGYARLKFEASSVEALELGEADIVVALHACDTATDVALYKAVVANASIIMAAPCCQKELRPQLKVPLHERPLFKHDTFKDRYSQMLTDALRGLLLESQGYRTKVIEFISDAHTHRNVMIVGVLDAKAIDRGAKRAEALELRQRYGVEHQQLETLLSAADR